MTTSAERAAVAAAEQAFARIVAGRNPGSLVRFVEPNVSHATHQSSAKEGASRTA